MTNLIQEKLQELEKLKVYHNGGFRELRYDLGHDRFSTIKDFFESSLQSMQEETRREIRDWAQKEKDEALKESQVKAQDHFRQAINQSEFGRYQAMRDLLDFLSSPKQEGEATKATPEEGKDTDVPTKCPCHCHGNCTGVGLTIMEGMHTLTCSHCNSESEKTESVKEEK